MGREQFHNQGEHEGFTEKAKKWILRAAIVVGGIGVLVYMLL